MEKTKEIIKNKENGKKEKLSKDEMIQKLEKEIEAIKVAYHQKTGALAYLKEID